MASFSFSLRKHYEMSVECEGVSDGKINSQGSEKHVAKDSVGLSCYREER